MSISFKNNTECTGTIVVNKIVEKLFGIKIGGHPSARHVEK